MGADSKIEWTHHTFNPWRGCTKVADGCAHCYAESLSKRNPGTLGIWGPVGTRVVASESMWSEPVKWNAAAECLGYRPRVFCASLADVFEAWNGQIQTSSGEWANNAGKNGSVDRFAGCSLAGGTSATTMNNCRERLFRLIDATPNLDWLLLTKRPENIQEMWPAIDESQADMTTLLANHFRAVDARIAAGGAFNDPAKEHVAYVAERTSVAYRTNVWLGTSVAVQKDADTNLPHLVACKRAGLVSTLFVSAEPLLAHVRLQHDFDGKLTRNWLGEGGINWVIVGGESGPHARPMHPDWARSLRDQCRMSGVAFHFKQWGEWATFYDRDNDDPDWRSIPKESPSVCRLNLAGGSGFHGERLVYLKRFGKKNSGRLLDGREWNEFPTIHSVATM